MLKKRLIPILYIKNGFIIRSETFSSHKIIGNVVNEVRRYNEWNVDELVYIDISREDSYDTKREDHKIERVKSIDQILELVSKECFMPLTFGGGIRNYQTIYKYLKNGADKVVLNTMIHENPDQVIQAIKNFGAQAIVASLDYRIIDDQIIFYSNYGVTKIDKNLNEIASYLKYLNVGEVFLTSIDRDGTAEGYDLKTIKQTIDAFEIPVVACGGAANIFDFQEISELSDLSGVAAGNMFHFTENIYPRSKKKLKENKFNYR